MVARVYPVDAVSGSPQYSGRALRQTLAALLPGATAPRPLGGQSGVRPGTPSTTVSVAGSTWSVAAHAGVLDVEASALAGPYVYAFDATVTGAVTAAHATYTRWDGIYVQLSDPAESDGTSTPGVAIVYQAGTAAASPAMPSQPARSLLLARIVVPPSGGGSASVVWLAPMIMPSVASAGSFAELQLRNPSPGDGARAVVGSGSSLVEFIYRGGWRLLGIPQFPDTSTRDALITTPAAGDEVLVGSGATIDRYRYDGTAWRLRSRPWQSWTPVIGGITDGLSITNANYLVSEGVARYYVEMQCTGALTGSALRLTGLPIPMAVLAWTKVGDATLNPNGTRVSGGVYRYSTTQEVAIFGPPGTGTVAVEVAAAVPATWGARSQAILALWDAPAG